MKAYSYSRFSSDAQRPGTSIVRQQTLAEKWCEEHKIPLSTDRFKDEAVSGFSGANLESGALARFIALVKAGEIEAGSYLILESLDRLTRLNAWQASGLLQELVGLGIIVVTLRPEMRFDHNSTAIDLLQAILHMDNAHKESARKSDLGKGEWETRFRLARETKRHIGNRVSNWLTLDKQAGTYYLNEHAFAVGRIFELCLDGLGSTAISQTLNAEGYRTFNKGKRWGTTAVLTILKNRAAIGELALKDGGEPIPDYFPAVVSVETFDAAKNMVTVRQTGKITKQSADFNVWRKLVVCGACGSNMHIIQRTKFRYLMCANRRYGACEGSKNVRLDESEDVLMAMLLHLDALSLVMPDPDKLNRELQAAEGRLLTEREKLAIWTEQLKLHPTVPTYHDLVIESSGRIKALQADIERLTGELTGGEKLSWSEIRARIDLTDKPTRRRVNAFLHRLGVQVRISEGYLLVQRDVAVAMFAVEKNRIGYIALDNDMSEPWEPEEMPEGLVLTGGVGEAPKLQQANAIAAGVKKRLRTGGIGGSAVGTLTVPNGRGTRRITKST
ncbi:recombinase family protein [Massilia arenae]|uniref:Recombinase family protein n=1 Tax=Massilia arenae TaxID=2603288 RepID=A0A5C7G782_9BURK|nr:recombinase family protein [Massilia arenae]TXG01906.1 recombinase family protein [Massilia arenae]